MASYNVGLNVLIPMLLFMNKVLKSSLSCLEQNKQNAVKIVDRYLGYTSQEFEFLIGM